MCHILLLIGLLEKGTFESSFKVDSPIIMYTITTAAGRMSSVIVWGLLTFCDSMCYLVKC
jgi:hypothetical protein